VSNPIRYDPLLVRALAAELDRRLAGRRSAPAPIFAADRSVTLPLEGDEALVFDLHPSRGWVRLLPRPTAELLGEARVLGVTAPEDERRLSVQLALGSRFAEQRRELVIELMDNQWNALLTDAESGAIVSLLRGRDDRERLLAPGELYRPPAPCHRLRREGATREEALAAWLALLSPLSPAERAAALVREFANTGSFSARALLAHAGEDEAGLVRAFEWWWRVQPPAPTCPMLLHLDARAQPYPAPLPGVPGEPAGSLLEAMARAAEAQPEPSAPVLPSAAEAPDAEMVALAKRRHEMVLRRIRRLEEQIARAAEAPVLRGYGDLLLAHLYRVPKGAAAVVLPGWEGGEVEIALDPALSPTENAKLWYERARRRERAGERLPELLDEARAEAARWASFVAGAERGEPLPAWALERLRSAPKPDEREEESRPYRRYRTSGGLEVWVGKSAKANDRLTFGHARPDDVWLHARQVAGSHVVLRWKDAAGAPPARDLEEAASLAALFSRARTSAVVPVDWTRRKHVRKPRGAAAGAVLTQRVKTLFVEPDEALEKRLREAE
jgi:predicted ribosome quality control (RQC) complex YloA/Tae2 family protein